MKDRLLRDWSFARVLRAAFAAMFLAAAITRHEPIAWFAAAFFGMQAVFNIGCCGIGTCQPGTRTTSAPDLNAPVTYEEIR